jgi:hypothetical protein
MVALSKSLRAAFPRTRTARICRARGTQHHRPKLAARDTGTRVAHKTGTIGTVVNDAGTSRYRVTMVTSQRCLHHGRSGGTPTAERAIASSASLMTPIRISRRRPVGPTNHLRYRVAPPRPPCHQSI